MHVLSVVSGYINVVAKEMPLRLVLCKTTSNNKQRMMFVLLLQAYDTFIGIKIFANDSFLAFMKGVCMEIIMGRTLVNKFQNQSNQINNFELWVQALPYESIGFI